MRLRVAVLASLVAALVAIVGPDAASAAPRHNHGLTINATPNPVIAGDAVLIYGQLNGPGSAGQLIRLYHRLDPDGRFTLIGTTTTDAFGFYEFTREEGVVTTNRSWFVRGPDGAHSRTLHELVAVLVSLAASSSTGDTNHPIMFFGHVFPNHAGERVYLQEHVGQNGDDWTTLDHGRLDADSNYAIAYRWSRPGVHELRAVFRGDERNIGATSGNPIEVTIDQTQVADFTIKWGIHLGQVGRRHGRSAAGRARVDGLRRSPGGAAYRRRLAPGVTSSCR